MAELRRPRAAAQWLDRPLAATPEEVVRRLLAVQAQDLRAARLALRARSRATLTAAGVDAALAGDRSLVVAWLCRGTLHLVCADDYPWLLALTAPPRFAASRRRLGQEGVGPDDADRAVTVIERALADEGPLTRRELAERIAARGIRTEGQATSHLLMLAALRGVVVLAGEQRYVLARDWLGAPPGPVDRDHALAELARRYLVAHGPATAADLAAWSGLPLGDARAGLGIIAGELLADGALVDLAAREPPSRPVGPRLLGAFDPYLLGWKDRSFAVSPEHARRVHPGGGVLRAVATVDGLVVGTWSARRGVEIEAFNSIDGAIFRAEIDDVARFNA